MAGSKAQYAADDRGYSLPALLFPGELFPAAPGDGIELRFAVILRSAPFGFDPAVLLEPQELSIDCAFIQTNGVLTHLLQTAGDAESVERAYGVQCFENHKVESALEDL
jgi:hypothetical protein